MIHLVDFVVNVLLLHPLLETERERERERRGWGGEERGIGEGSDLLMQHCGFDPLLSHW